MRSIFSKIIHSQIITFLIKQLSKENWLKNSKGDLFLNINHEFLQSIITINE